jgi:ribosome maturation factor RimP
VISLGRRELEDRLFADFEPLVRNAGVELLDVEMLSENKRTVLRATIYRPEGITLDDCVRTQHILSDRLDETDPIPGSYSLEVSSPGIERVLKRPKEFAIYRGQPCQVSLYAPQDGKRVFEGRLVELAVEPDGSETVVIEVDSETAHPGGPMGAEAAGRKSPGEKPTGGKPAGGKPAGEKSASLKVGGGRSAGGKPTGEKSAGSRVGGRSAGGKAQASQEDGTAGRRLVSFDRRNVSKVKLLYRDEKYKKGRN